MAYRCNNKVWLVVLGMLGIGMTCLADDVPNTTEPIDVLDMLGKYGRLINVAGAQGQLSFDTEKVLRGKHSLKITNKTGKASVLVVGPVWDSPQRLAVEPGDQYHFKAKVHAKQKNARATIGFEFYDRDKQLIERKIGSKVPFGWWAFAKARGTDHWAPIELSATVPAGARFMQLVLEGTTGANFWWDEVELQKIGSTNRQHFVIAQEEGVYYAWPTVDKLSDGELLAVVYQGKSHMQSHGKVVLYRSKDNARTWDQGTVVADTILDDRDPGIMVMRDDTIIVSSRVHWWEGRDDEQIKGKEEQARELVAKFYNGYLIRSTDRGKTWSQKMPYPFQTHGPIELKDGNLFSVGWAQEGQRFGAFISKDKGQSWQKLSEMPSVTKKLRAHGLEVESNADSEPHFAELADGRLVVFFRKIPSYHNSSHALQADFSHLYVTYSNDGGLSWSKPVKTAIGGYPPDVLVLNDKRVLVSYGYRFWPYGQRAMISDDGYNFGAYVPIIIRDDAPDDDLGYPSSVQLDDGRILTVYYQKPLPGKKPVFMGTIWVVPN